MTKLDISELTCNELAWNAGIPSWMDRSKHVSDRQMGSLSRMVERLVTETHLRYDEIVRQVKEAYPEANTSTKSVASVASTLRKKGVAVPLRLNLL